MFWSKGTNSTADLGSKGDSSHILSTLQTYLTMSPELRNWPYSSLFNLIWPNLELSRRGKVSMKGAQNCSTLTCWHKVLCGVCAFRPKNIWAVEFGLKLQFFTWGHHLTSPLWLQRFEFSGQSQQKSQTLVELEAWSKDVQM